MSEQTPNLPHVQIRVSPEEFDIGAEWQSLRQRSQGELGAVATFIGLVRDRDQGEAVTGLHLEHYPGMTEQSIERIVSVASERWPLLDVLVVHRVGELAPRDQIVFVQVASGHRAAAFSAAQLIMDYLKTDAVIWKREDKATGGQWLQASELDEQRKAQWRPPAQDKGAPAEDKGAPAEDKDGQDA